MLDSSDVRFRYVDSDDGPQNVKFSDSTFSNTNFGLSFLSILGVHLNSKSVINVQFSFGKAYFFSGFQPSNFSPKFCLNNTVRSALWIDRWKLSVTAKSGHSDSLKLSLNSLKKNLPSLTASFTNGDSSQFTVTFPPGFYAFKRPDPRTKPTFTSLPFTTKDIPDYDEFDYQSGPLHNSQGDTILTGKNFTIRCQIGSKFDPSLDSLSISLNSMPINNSDGVMQAKTLNLDTCGCSTVTLCELDIQGFTPMRRSINNALRSHLYLKLLDPTLPRAEITSPTKQTEYIAKDSLLLQSLGFKIQSNSYNIVSITITANEIGKNGSGKKFVIASKLVNLPPSISATQDSIQFNNVDQFVEGHEYQYQVRFRTRITIVTQLLIQNF